MELIDDLLELSESFDQRQAIGGITNDHKELVSHIKSKNRPNLIEVVTTILYDDKGKSPSSKLKSTKKSKKPALKKKKLKKPHQNIKKNAN